MPRFILFFLIGLFSIDVALALHLPSKSKIPKLFYRVNDDPKYANKEYVTVKSDDFNLLAKKHEVKEGKIYWKTIKIKIKNEQAVSTWPYTLQEMIKNLREKSTPREPLFDLSIFANPVSFATVNQQRTINAGYRITSKSTISEKHEFGHDSAINHSQGISDFDGTKLENISYSSNLNYDFNRFYGKWTYFAITGYRRERMNGIYNIKDQVRLGITGVKYAFIRDGEFIKKLDFSYIPLFEWVSSDNDIQAVGEPPSKTTETVRNSFRYRLRVNFLQWSFEHTVNYQPAYLFKTDTLDMQDIDLKSMFVLRRPLSERLSFTYSNDYSYDIRRIRSGQAGQRRDNAINSFSLDWTLEI